MEAVRIFLLEVQAEADKGNATEHSYRPALKKLFDSLDKGISATNEPKRLEGGAPDFVIQQGEIAIGYVEAKDIHIDIGNLTGENKKQQERYCRTLSNLIYTNCRNFDFYRNGKLFQSISIADYKKDKAIQQSRRSYRVEETTTDYKKNKVIQPKPDNFATLENVLRDFMSQRPQTITDPKALATLMAHKAKLIKDAFTRTLGYEGENGSSGLSSQYQAFKDQLIHSITPEDFADIYAETITYGMFAARLHDPERKSFSRAEAHALLPKSNPFLRSLFSYIASVDLDERIRWAIDDLTEIFRACNVPALMQGYGKLSGRTDPFLHFYEDFLKEYNPEKRNVRGVWYTPTPVVQFIVRAVDDLLKRKFRLDDGLADSSRVTIDWYTGDTAQNGEPVSTKKEVHRVQILDPAAGTGTFLAEIIKHIVPKLKSIAPDAWPGYVERELIPRLHGFELLMASYTMCHIKLDRALAELDYHPTEKAPRLSAYLTNSLEEGEHKQQELPFARWLTEEANAANKIKRNMPIMCVIGNPPYSGESANKGPWIGDLMDAYKTEPGGQKKLQERNPKWINDDYVKFIRFAEHMIARNGEGILGFVTNHSYLDNPTFRGMRWHLLKTFDWIYILDLHGNAKKKEVAPSGKPDKNVFDIQQGVAIIIALKRSGTQENKLAEVRYSELWGERKTKYQHLQDGSLTSIKWKKLKNRKPQYVFVLRNYALEKKYQCGFSLPEFMPVNSVGIVTARDALTIDIDKASLWQCLGDFARAGDTEALRNKLCQKYNLVKDAQDWTLHGAVADVKKNFNEKNLVQIAYRLFDTRWTFYTGASRGFHCRPRAKTMRHFLQGKNLGLVLCKQFKTGRQYSHAFVTDRIMESSYISNRTSEINYVFPLYCYLAKDELDLGRVSQINFEPKIHEKLVKLASHKEYGKPDELQILDYIYGVLHCPSYRDSYAEFLRMDFPRIPYPQSPDLFWQISAKGRQLRELHLMRIKAVGKTHYPFKGRGKSTIEKPEYRSGSVYINETQHFADVPKAAWDFYIGGYQPAQKWLKDRKGKVLALPDLKHYRKIVKILVETDRIMKDIKTTWRNLS